MKECFVNIIKTVKDKESSISLSEYRDLLDISSDILNISSDDVALVIFND
jgi:hypothetical protein